MISNRVLASITFQFCTWYIKSSQTTNQTLIYYYNQKLGKDVKLARDINKTISKLQNNSTRTD
jgi:hypothetical protein